jgi:hypothetical protein
MPIYSTATDVALAISPSSRRMCVGDAIVINALGEAAAIDSEQNLDSILGGYVRLIVPEGSTMPNGSIADRPTAIVTFLAGIRGVMHDLADALAVRGEAWLSLRCRREGFRAFVGRMRGNGLDGRFGEGVGADIVEAVARALWAFDVEPKSPAHGIESLIPPGGSR